jgi:DNA-binding beta-propeller fold protein YncE
MNEQRGWGEAVRLGSGRCARARGKGTGPCLFPWQPRQRRRPAAAGPPTPQQAASSSSSSVRGTGGRHVTAYLPAGAMQPRAAAEAGGGGRKKNVGLGFFCLGRAARAQRPQCRFFSSYYVNVYPPVRPRRATCASGAARGCCRHVRGEAAPPRAPRALAHRLFWGGRRARSRGGRLDAAHVFLAWLTRTRPRPGATNPSGRQIYVLLVGLAGWCSK